MRGFYAIIDTHECGKRHREPFAFAEEIAPFAAALQLRHKGAVTVSTVELARALQSLCERYSIPFFVNDHVEVARLLGCHLHVGQEDAPLLQLRSQFGGKIGVSTHSLEELDLAISQGADLCGFGPVFGTSTKANASPIVGLSLLRQACSRAVPIVAIGGIGSGNWLEVVDSGAALIAAISAPFDDAAFPSCLQTVYSDRKR